jgi:hypothetical protein
MQRQSSAGVEPAADATTGSATTCGLLAIVRTTSIENHKPALQLADHQVPFGVVHQLTACTFCWWITTTLTSCTLYLTSNALANHGDDMLLLHHVTCHRA